MHLILSLADFSENNIGTLNSWFVTKSVGTGATYSGPTSVIKGASFSATVTLADGYEVGSAGITFTMGGSALASYSTSGQVVTFTISSVTGNIVIKVPTKNTSSGNEDSGSSGDSGSESKTTVWYVDYRSMDAPSGSANIAGRGWTEMETSQIYTTIIGKPINTMAFFTTKDSQSVTVMKIASKGATTGTVIDTVTAIKDATGIATISFPTVTLTSGEYLSLFSSTNDDIQFSYSTTAKADVNGITSSGFYSRLPIVYGSGTTWLTANNCSLHWSYGYIS